MAQSQISTLEKIALALDVPSDFLKHFQPDEVLKNYHAHDNTMTNTAAEESKENIVQSGEQANTITYNYPIDKVVEMYDRLMKEKDEQTARFEKQIIDPVRQVEDLKNKIK